MSAHVVNHYLCPTCGNDWADTWSCACNDRCPACGLGDVEPLRTVEDCCNMEMKRAFEIVLELARDNQIDHLDSPGEHRTQGQALDLVTAYLLLKVKG